MIIFILMGVAFLILIAYTCMNISIYPSSGDTYTSEKLTAIEEEERIIEEFIAYDQAKKNIRKRK